jgi:sortase A
VLRLIHRAVAIVLVAAGIYVLGFVPYALFLSHHSAVVAQGKLGYSLAHGLKTDSPILHAQSVGPIPVVSWPLKIPDGTPIGKLTIPSAGVFGDVIVQGSNKVQLEEGPGHYSSSSMPGTPGNVALAGHRTTWLHPFYNLPSVKIGDRIELTVGSKHWVYRVVQRAVVSPVDVAVLAPLHGWYITLTTCTPLYSAAHRFVLRGVLSKSATLAANFTSHNVVNRDVQVVALPSSRAVLPQVPTVLLPVWLGVAALCVIGAVVAVKRSLALRILLIGFAGFAAFESYGVALNLLPRTW